MASSSKADLDWFSMHGFISYINNANFWILRPFSPIFYGKIAYFYFCILIYKAKQRLHNNGEKYSAFQSIINLNKDQQTIKL